jgi:holliday junction DNA helicase RuvB
MPRFSATNPTPENPKEPADTPEPPEDSVRPQRLDEIVGQLAIKESLEVFIKAAKVRKDAMDHTLLVGRPGLGKTTFAIAIGHELERPILYRDGPAFNAEAIQILVETELSPNPRLLQRLDAGPFSLGLGGFEDYPDDEIKEETVTEAVGPVVLVDEVHAIPREAFEALYPLMEDFTYHGVRVPKFTLIGATTDPGKLPAPFRDRFGIRYTIDFYSEDEINEILQRSYRIITATDPAAVQDETRLALLDLAHRSRGTPRTANRLLRRCLDFSIVREESYLTVTTVSDTMRAMGIDAFGLEDVDRKILVAMQRRFGRPVGLAAIAAAVGEDVISIERVNEPWLVRAGYIDRTRSGRVLTSDGETIVRFINEGRMRY